jgi:hypothetical protein
MKIPRIVGFGSRLIAAHTHGDSHPGAVFVAFGRPTPATGLS